jgi:hypothetical protein
MSVNFNRKITKNAFTNNEFMAIRFRYWHGCWYEEYGKLKTGLYPNQRRMYRTWKHNRKTQYKLN